MTNLNSDQSLENKQPANLLRRFAAILYDSILVIALLWIGSLPVIMIHGDAITASIFYQAYLLSIWFSFYAWFWTHGGQTLGMKAWKLYVCQSDGTSIRWHQAAIRFFSAALGVANITMLINHQKLGWHEQLSQTQTLKK